MFRSDDDGFVQGIDAAMHPDCQRSVQGRGLLEQADAVQRAGNAGQRRIGRTGSAGSVESVWRQMQFVDESAFGCHGFDSDADCDFK